MDTDLLDEEDAALELALELSKQEFGNKPYEPGPSRAQNQQQFMPSSPSTSTSSSPQLRFSMLDSDDDEDGNISSSYGGLRPILVRNGGPSKKKHVPPAPPVSQEAEAECLLNVLSIFPDACPNHIKKLYNENRILQGANVAEFLANKLAEEGFPQAQKPEIPHGKKRKRVDENESDDEDKGLHYEAADRARPDWRYINLVQKLLQQEFPFVPVAHINTVLGDNKHFLIKAYPILFESERNYAAEANPPYRRLVRGRKVVRTSYENEMGKCWAELAEELVCAHEVCRKKELVIQSQRDAQLAAQINEKEHEACDMMIECQCCFSEYTFDFMTHCNETHFFCLDCARRNAENEVGNGRHKLLCMDGSGCKAEFGRQEILRFVDEKTLIALAKVQQEESLRMAGIEDLVQCPFCDFGAICPPIEENREFSCLNPECLVVSCRRCRQKTHIPITCEEYAKENKTTFRHTIEEAMTDALVRKCIACAAPFIKESGCNKIHCQRCGTLQCYICLKPIKGYDHFNDQSRGGNPGNCLLFDNTEERHETEIQTAGKKARDRVREENPGLDEEDLEIMLSDEVKKIEANRRARAAPRGYWPPAIPAPQMAANNLVQLPGDYRINPLPEREAHFAVLQAQEVARMMLHDRQRLGMREEDFDNPFNIPFLRPPVPRPAAVAPQAPPPPPPPPRINGPMRMPAHQPQQVHLPLRQKVVRNLRFGL